MGPEAITESSDSFGIEAIAWLVEDEYWGVAEEGSRQAETLPHPE